MMAKIWHVLSFNVFLKFFLPALLAGWFGVPPALAWKHNPTHMAINETAIAYFEKNLRSQDARLAGTSLNGASCRGLAWDPQDGSAQTTQSVAVERSKTLARWIIDGGYSADEPEIMMGLRHFHDPKNPSVPWLTDTHGVADWLEAHLTPERGIPEIDAITWAIDSDDRGDDGAYGVQEWISISQDYSWFDARKYYKLALADESRDNLNYGKAWRSVGEVMHLMADMTQPAHVRNDGHMRYEPLEDYTLTSQINANAANSPCSNLNYNAGVETLMRAVARWTSENFCSQDTVPLPGVSTTANGRPAYGLPAISPPAGGARYVYHTVAGGGTIRLARVGRAGIWQRWFQGYNSAQSYQVDEKAVMDDYLKILVPTAIRACAAVLNRFLPRFSITAEVSQDPDMAASSYYTVHGEVEQTLEGSDWNEKLTIKNGVYLVINGVATAIPKRIAGGDFNSFSHDFSAKDNDEVWLRYDLGGYVVESTRVRIVATTASPLQFTKTWVKSHWPSYYPELAKITFTVRGGGQVTAIKPTIKFSDYSNSENSKIISITNMKHSENVVIDGSLQPSLSKTTISPYAPTVKYEYTYTNPTLVRCSEFYAEKQIVERYSAMNFTWNVPAGMGYHQTEIYLVYDLEVKEYKREDEKSSFYLVSTKNYKSPEFHLTLQAHKLVPDSDDL